MHHPVPTRRTPLVASMAVVLLVLPLVPTSPVWATPILQITSGAIAKTDFYPNTWTAVAGEGFSISGVANENDFWVPGPVYEPVKPGETVPLFVQGTLAHFNLYDWGSWVLPGYSSESAKLTIDPTGVLGFYTYLRTPDLTLPDPADPARAETRVLLEPFALDVRLLVCIGGERDWCANTGVQFEAFRLVGTGTAQLLWQWTPADEGGLPYGYWWLDEATFAFGSPVPEPSTLLLLGSGLAGLGGVAWGRNRKGAWQ